MKRNLIRRMTFAATLAALYFILCVVEGPLASGFMVNVRLAEGLTVFAFFAPEVIVGASIGCFIYNFFFGFGLIDALIGTSATLIGTVYIYLLGRFIKKDYLRMPLFGLMLVILNAILVPVVLIISLPDDLSWAMYWGEFAIVGLGEALAVYLIGIPLYFACKKWLPKLLGNEESK